MAVRPIPLVLGAALLAAGLLFPLLLDLASGVPSRPMRGNSMHGEGEGSIRDGDLLVLGEADRPLATWAMQGPRHFGDAGEVVAYERPDGSVIVARLLTWVNVSGQGGARSYEVLWVEAGRPTTWTFGPEGVTLPEAALAAYKPEASSWITRGDNPRTNPSADQAAGIAGPVTPEMLVGRVVAALAPWQMWAARLALLLGGAAGLAAALRPTRH